MAGESLLWAFTPSRMSPELLEQIFVAREPLAVELVQAVESAVAEPARAHKLLLGPRGMGKTHLISLVYHRLRSRPTVEAGARIAWLPEDSFELSSYSRLLEIALKRLGETYPNEPLPALPPAGRACRRLRAAAPRLA